MRAAIFLLLILFLPPATASTQAPGDSIGFTYYDYLTSGSATRNLINFGDGEMAFARTASVDTIGSSRGTYYKYFDGSGWSPGWSPIEAIRTSLSSMDQIRDAGGVEVVLSSETISVDASRGANVWTEILFPCELIGPRLAIGNGFTIHVVGLADMGIAYHGSFDAGATWSCGEYPFSHEGAVAEPDGYDIAAWEGNVAFVVAGAGGDVVLVESSDGGASWTERVIYDIDETLMTEGEEPPDGSCSIIYDEGGGLHIAWGSYLSDGAGSYMESIDAGIRYWNEEGGVAEIAWPVDDPTIVNPGGRDGNLASQPDIAVFGINEIIIVYSSFISERDSRGNNYEHVFAVWICNGVGGWSWDLTEGTGFDAAFPSVADLGDDQLHFTYTADRFAGNAVSGVHEPIPVAHMYHKAEYPPCYDCCFPPPYPPPLVSPPDGAIGVPTSGPLVWEGQWPPVSHQVQVSGDSIFSAVILDTNVAWQTSLELDGLLNGNRYYWRVQAENGWGTSSWSEVWSFTTLVTAVEEQEPQIPSRYFLYQNHPNPFNPTTIFRFGIRDAGVVVLKIYDLLGREAATVVNERLAPGTYTRQWDASGLTSGVYYYRLGAGSYVETKKLMLVR